MIPEPLSIVGSNAERTRLHNRRLVLGHVRAAGESGRAEIARACGLSTQAVSNIIAELETEGLLRETGRRPAGRGLPALQYALNPAGGYALGIEIRPDALFLALLDLDGSTHFVRREALAEATPPAVSRAILRLRDRALKAAAIPADKLLGAGVVMPGPFGATGLSGTGSELPGWSEVDAADHLRDCLGLPVIVENDANAAAVAERISGVARDLNTYAYLYFGTGIGLGIVNGGTLLRGAFGNAGEIGHIPVPGPDGPVTLEAVASRLAVRDRLRAAGHEVRTGDDLDILYRAGDPTLAAWAAEAAAALSHAVLTVENLFDPEAVILGGAMPDALLDHLIGRIALSPLSLANRPARAVPRLLRGASGRMTATLGGAALVINQAFTPRLSAAAV